MGARTICALSGIASFAFCFVAMFLLSECDQRDVLKFFQQHLREPLFIGLLTVATFLFSLKTFIVVTMHDKVYSTASYENDWKLKRQLDSSLRRFAPLENFADLLFLSILVSLIGAALQFTLGVYDAAVSAATCIAISMWSIAMIFVSLFYLQKNLWEWFKFLDDASKK